MTTAVAFASAAHLAAYAPIPFAKKPPLWEIRAGKVLDAEILDAKGNPSGRFSTETFQALDGNTGRMRVNFIHDGVLRKNCSLFRSTTNYDGGGYVTYDDKDGKTVTIYLSKDGKILPKGPFTPKPVP